MALSSSIVDRGPPIAIGDTGCTSHFASTSAPVINKKPANPPIPIRNPNGAVMWSTHEAELDIPNLPLVARKCHLVPDLHDLSLISIGQLCDAGCTVSLNATTMTVRFNGRVALTGTRTNTTRLWQIDLDDPSMTPST